MTERQSFTKLREALAFLYDDQIAARRVAYDAGLEVDQISFSNKATDNWYNILLQAEREGKTAALMAVTFKEYRENETFAKVWHDYLVAIGAKPRSGPSNPPTHVAQRWVWSSLGVFLLILLILGVIFLPRLLGLSFITTTNTFPSVASVASTDTPIRFSFEEFVQGWVKQDYEDAQACVEVFQSREKAHEGDSSLVMRMDLDGGDPNNHKRQGEAWVDMRSSRPNGIKTVPIDLTNRIVTMWVYAPPGARGGDPQKPNGFQVFLKSENDWRSEYSPWHDVIEDGWTQISLTIRDAGPTKAEMEKGAYRDSDFDPSRVIAIGVKMGAGDSPTATYRGLIYVDEIGWE